MYKEKKVWRGYNIFDKFNRPDGTIKTSPSSWYTNLKVAKKKKLELVKPYNEERYPKYCNYDAIECSRVKDIPKDYYDKIAVPVGFFEYDFEDEFDYLGQDFDLEKTKEFTLKKIKTGKIYKLGKNAGNFFYESDEPGYKLDYINLDNGKYVRWLFRRYVIRRKRKSSN